MYSFSAQQNDTQSKGKGIKQKHKLQMPFNAKFIYIIVYKVQKALIELLSSPNTGNMRAQQCYFFGK